MSEDINGQPSGSADTSVLGGSAPAATESAAPAIEEKQPVEAQEKAAEAPKTEADPKTAAKAESQPAAKAEASAPSWPDEGFPENWRERTLQSLNLEGDALKRAAEVAKRASSPAELLRSVMAGTAKITELTAELKGAVKIPGEKAKAEEVEAFHKAWGVPEKADGYDLKPLGELSEVDKEIWDEVLPSLHKGHVSQAQMGVMAAALKTAETIAAKKMQDRAEAAKKATDDALLVEYGSRKEVNANIELANRYLGELLGKHMDGEARSNFLKLQLADGTSIGAHQGFVKAIVEAARQWAPEGMPDIGEGGQRIDIKARMDEIMSKAHSKDPATMQEYKRLQPELMKLTAAYNRRNNGAGAST